MERHLSVGVSTIVALMAAHRLAAGRDRSYIARQLETGHIDIHPPEVRPGPVAVLWQGEIDGSSSLPPRV
jgi:hypothetical protein